MRVKILLNLGSNDFPGHPYLEGEEHEVVDRLGAKLVRCGLAVDVTPPPVESEPEPEAVAPVVEAIKPEAVKAPVLPVKKSKN